MNFLFVCFFFLQKDSQGPFRQKPKNIDYVVGGTVDDRSILSDEMAALCAKLPIYRIQLKSVAEVVEKQSESQLSRKLNCFSLLRWNCFEYLQL